MSGKQRSLVFTVGGSACIPSMNWSASMRCGVSFVRSWCGKRASGISWKGIVESVDSMEDEIDV